MEHFFEVKNNSPKKGQVMARYSAMAELVAGDDKLELIKIIKTSDFPLSIAQFVKQVLHSDELDSYRLPQRISEDLLSGMTEEEVMEKPYRYKIELFYYVEPQYIPDDPHWNTVALLNLDKFLSVN